MPFKNSRVIKEFIYEGLIRYTDDFGVLEIDKIRPTLLHIFANLRNSNYAKRHAKIIRIEYYINTFIREYFHSQVRPSPEQRLQRQQQQQCQQQTDSVNKST